MSWLKLVGAASLDGLVVRIPVSDFKSVRFIPSRHHSAFFLLARLTLPLVLRGASYTSPYFGLPCILQYWSAFTIQRLKHFFPIKRT